MPPTPAPPTDRVPDDALPDLAARWAERLARVRRSQARTDVTGMTRPPLDPDERAFLAARGRLGPFRERANAGAPDAPDAPAANDAEA
jgi:hypothetical protein